MVVDERHVPRFVAGRFELLARAGAGGMGVVFRARDLTSGLDVALKLMRPPENADRHDPLEIERFAREARILAGLVHPAVVRYVAHGIADKNEPYLAMEWLDGENVMRRVARAPLTVRESLAIGARLASGLAAIHERGIVHRDVKPSNVMLVGDGIGDARLLDFGIARLGIGSELTRTGGILGTAGYTAPEQARGRREIDGRADLYSLGCLLFRCIAGHAPVEGFGVADVLAKTLFEDPPRLSSRVRGVPGALDDLVASLLAKRPEDRPASAEVVARALLDIASSLAESTTQPSHPPAQGISETALGGDEQRLVTVVFAGPAQIVDATEPALGSTDSSVRAIVAAHRGRFETLADRSLVAVWTGSGDALEQAARAARSALALRREFPKRSIALVTGRGTIDRAVPVGEAIDRAIALSIAHHANAAPGVHVDDVTAGLLDSRFVMSGAELVEERAQGTTPRLLLGRATPCVGRNRELATLLAAYDECSADEVARAVLVTGEPGLGKSRLRHELVGLLREREAPPSVWLARADPMRAGSPFAVLAQLALSSVSRDGDDPPASIHGERVRASLRARGGAAGAVAARLDALSRPARGGDDASPALADAVVRSFVDLASDATSRGPLVIVIEDLHASDMPSVRAIDACLRELGDRALFVLALARPAVKATFPELWPRRGLVEIELARLSRKVCEAFVRERLGGSIADDAARRIAETSEGNPLHLEELVRAAASGNEVPGSLLAILEARLDAIDAEARRCLRAASVFGRIFSGEGLRALAGPTSQPIAVTLAELERLELVHRQRDLGPDAWAFRHALAREAAYVTLTEPDRVLGHRLAAEWLERSGDADAIVLADHFEQAGEPVSAARWYAEAAERAFRGDDSARARAHAERALGLGTGDVVCRALLVLARAAMWSGDYDVALARATAVIEQSTPGDARWSGAVNVAIFVRGARLERDALVSLGELLLATTPSTEGPESYLAACSRAAQHLSYAGYNDMTKRLLEVGTRRATSPEPVSPVLSCAIVLARVPIAQLDNDWARYSETSAEGSRLVGESGDVVHSAYLRVNALMGRCECGLYDGIEELRGVLEAASKSDTRVLAAWTSAILGLTLFRSGARVDAQRALDAGFTELARMGETRLGGMVRAVRARVSDELGRHDEAEADARAAAAALEPFPPPWTFATAVLARILVGRGRAGEARRVADEARAVLDRVGAVGFGEALVRLVHAEALEADGAHDLACAAIVDARATLLRWADRFDDPARRDAFLRIDDHATTLRLARAWLGDEPARFR